VIQLRLAHFITVLQQSLCSEMAEELRFAVRCHGSRQRPALKRSCTRCSPGTTYVPAALEMPHINGVSEYLQRSTQSNKQSPPAHYAYYNWVPISKTLLQNLVIYYSQQVGYYVNPKCILSKFHFFPGDGNSPDGRDEEIIAELRPWYLVTATLN